MHNATTYIIKWCIKNDIDTIVIGKNKEWKQEKKNMQNFIYIPYEIFISQLKYKCEDHYIKFVECNESYTSGTSFLDNESPEAQYYNKSRRIYRGLFKSNFGLLINSDVNGSFQIMKKVFPNAINRYGIEGFLTPIVINAVKTA